MEFDPRWDLVEEKLSNNIGHYESLFTLANGYLGTRGATEEGRRERTPGTFLAGLFDAAPREVTELPNLPDWLSVEFSLAGERLDLTQGEILDYYRVLRLKDGTLERFVRWKSPQGRISCLHFSRFVSIADHHLAGQRCEIIPENYSGTIRLVSRLDGQVTNSGTQHLAPVEASTFPGRGIYLMSETYEAKHLVVQAAAHRPEGPILGEGYANGQRRIDYWVELEAEAGRSLALEKLVTTHSSRDLELEGMQKSQELLLAWALNANERAQQLGFQRALEEHVLAWQQRWEKADLVIDGPDFDQLALRFALFHLMQMASWHDHRVSVAAKGLSGEGYRGHVFWDTEIFIQPFFLHVFPEVARMQLRYRHHTLPGALRKARENGYEGAMYPWESAETGDETTPTVGAIDFETRKPIPILTGKYQQHITADIAYAIARYLEVTGDKQFLEEYGAEVVLLGARFWASRVEYSAAEDCYDIKAIMGPDEYKEIVDNNAYTNLLVQKHLLFAGKVLSELTSSAIIERWGFSQAEGEKWAELAAKIRLPRRGDLLEQFDGFLKLKEIDVLKYRDTPGALQKAYSWRQITGSQVLKQADVVMLLHLLPEEFTAAEKKANWDFYEPKTMHDSSLSAAIHSAVACELGLAEEAYRYFQKASRIDLGDGLQNSAHGLHAASLGGLWQAAVHGFAGVRIAEGVLHIGPQLPEVWAGLRCRLQVGGLLLGLEITKTGVQVTPLSGAGEVRVQVGSQTTLVSHAGGSVQFTYAS